MHQTNLVLVRHGQSEWNERNLFTGWKNPDLTQLGVEEARQAGRELEDLGYRFKMLFSSDLQRAQRTGDLILDMMKNDLCKKIYDYRLNERNYGDLAGLNKDDARKRWGEKQVHIWRRSYDVSPPGGESLRDTAERVIPFFEEVISPELEESGDVLIVAHGNSLRALVMKIEGLSTREIIEVEIKTGRPLCYQINEESIVRIQH